MAFFDWLTDAFTGRPAQQYGQQALAGGQYLAGQTQATAANAAAGTQAAAEAAARETTGAGTALAAGTREAAANLAPQVAGYFDTVTGPRVEGAYAPLSNLAQSYQPQIDQYYKMLAGGPNAGLSQFQQSPGFDFQLNKGIEALTRAGNTGGMGVSGNVLREAQNYGTGLANQDFYNWVNSVYQPYAGRLGAFVPAQANILGNVANSLGNYYSGTGNTVANAYGQGAQLTAGANTNLANLIASANANRANLMGGANQNLANLTAGNNAGLANLAQGIYSGQASAQQQGSSNFWNAALGAGKIAAGMPPGSFGGGGTPSAGSYFNGSPGDQWLAAGQGYGPWAAAAA